VRAFPITVLSGGIDRLRVKGGASANKLYDLQNAYITNAGAVVPREGTIRAATLDSSTVGLMSANGQFNIFSSTFSTAALPANYVLNVLSNPVNASSSPTTIWFAKPFMGFPYVVAQFSDTTIHHYWLQNNGTWTSSTDYTSASIVLPPVLNGLAYQGVRDFPSQPLWTADSQITSGSYIEPNTPTGFTYQAIAVTGSPVHTGLVEPVWPTIAGGIIQEFGDFDVSSTDAGTTQGTNSPFSTASPLNATITDRYGNSATIANSGIFATSNSTLSSLTLASTKVTTWAAGTNYAPGAVVVPSTTQGAFVNAIPNGDFEGGSGAGGWTFTDPAGTAQWAYNTVLPYQGAECIAIPGGSAIGAGGALATMTSFSLVTPGQQVTASAYVNPNNNGANLTVWIQLNWYNSGDGFISATGNQQNEQEGFGYRKISVTGTAPTGAAHCRVAIGAGSGTNSRNAGFADLVTWNLESPSAVTNFLFEAVQPTAATSAATEPTWPTSLGATVIDGGVTWKAIGTSIITWQAIPLMQSGLVAPIFPTTIGNTVSDFSTYSNQNGFITTQCSMSWQCVDRHVSDPNCPNTVAVTIGASHVFDGNNDIVGYSAAVNPIDWSSTNNAGYLPTGLNNYGDNPVAALALYRSNLIAFNASGYQMWQIDPDPQNMALLDAQPVGSIYPRAAQSVANDLLFLTEVGVRNLGTIGATANMAIGNTGQPVDILVQAQLSGIPIYPLPIPAGGDPFITSVGLLLHFDGTSGSSVFLDSSPQANVVTAVGQATIQTSTVKFGTGAWAPTLSTNGGLTAAYTTGSPLDLSFVDWTIEFWLFPQNLAASEQIIAIPNVPTPSIRISWNPFTDAITGNIEGTAFTMPNNSVPVGVYQHIACVMHSNVFQTYVNGIAQGAPITMPRGQLANGNIAIANPNTGATEGALNSPIDELRITKRVARYTANFTPPTAPFPNPVPPPKFQPISLYYPGRGQYWLIFGPQALVLTMNGSSQKTWSRYIFPDIITDWTLNAGILYLRSAGNLVWQFDAATIGVDDSNTVTTIATPTPFNGVMQWPYLDLGSIGINKMLVGVDLVGTGNCRLQIAFNQNDPSTFVDNVANFAASTGVTTPYFVQIDDTIPGEPLAIPINAPSYSPILTFTGSTTSANAWSFQAANIYYQPSPSNSGGALG
jgi:hypothetical protein